MVKLLAVLRGRYNDQRRAYRTLISVGGSIDDRNCVRTFLLCSKGGGTAAIQVDCSYTASLKHNLSQLLSAAAGREWLLTAIQNHQNDFSGCCNAYAGSGMATVVVVSRTVYDRLSIFDEIHTSADGFLNFILICCIFRRTANDRSSIFQNSKEIFAAYTVIFGAFHHQ